MERIKLAVEKARLNRQSPMVLPVVSKFSGSVFNAEQTKKIQVDMSTYHNNRIIVGQDHQDARLAYKLLRTQVLRRMSDNNWNSLAITSPGAGEGKSLTAINLAISLAREVNHTVLLVDMDLNTPSIARYFDYQPKLGVGDYLKNGAEINEIMLNPGIERLVILPGRESLPDSSDLMSSPKMVNLIAELKSRYTDRLILFDMPPMLYADDVLAFSPYVDALLIVIEEGKTRQDALLRSVNLLSSQNIIGTVLNKTTSGKNKNY